LLLELTFLLHRFCLLRGAGVLAGIITQAAAVQAGLFKLIQWLSIKAHMPLLLARVERHNQPLTLLGLMEQTQLFLVPALPQ
jgi:hypothetical protein